MYVSFPGDLVTSYSVTNWNPVCLHYLLLSRASIGQAYSIKNTLCLKSMQKNEYVSGPQNSYVKVNHIICMIDQVFKT